VNQDSGRINGILVQGSTGSSGTDVPKLAKLDFPLFNKNEEPTRWICRQCMFFEFKISSDEEKVSLVAYHLEGEAQLWYQMLRE
jgi:hypothetical protein